MPAIVTLDIYSGVPNPSWTLSDDQVQELQRKIGRTSGAEAQGGSLPVLGYRGFIIRPVESEHAPGPRRDWRRATREPKNPCCRGYRRPRISS